MVAQDDIVSVFLGATGASAEDLKQRTSEPEFLGSILEFMTMDDRWVMGFCDANGMSYDEPLAAAHVLLGTARTHWT